MIKKRIKGAGWGEFVHIHTTNMSRQMACKTWAGDSLNKGNRNIFLTLHYMDDITLKCKGDRQ